jgi:hypothetical protein
VDGRAGSLPSLLRVSTLFDMGLFLSGCVYTFDFIYTSCTLVQRECVASSIGGCIINK